MKGGRGSAAQLALILSTKLPPAHAKGVAHAGTNVTGGTHGGLVPKPHSNETRAFA